MTKPSPTTLQAQFHTLDQLLTQMRPFWQLRPFALRELPGYWGNDIRQWLQRLSLDDCAALESNSEERARQLAPFIPEAPAIHNASLVQTHPLGSPRHDTPATLRNHIPGRKWEQMQAFDAALIPNGAELLEWCAGKGHLGRLLAHHHGQQVTSLEWQSPLCREGSQLAERLDLPCEFHHQDVMSDTVISHLRPEQHAVALHACGKLHLRLLELGCQQPLSGITLSPCCYHLIDESDHKPLSQIASASQLRLSRHDLKLPLQDIVTAGRRERRLRERELSWRLGFDLLQREVRGVDKYLPCPSIPKGQLTGSFRSFCQWMAIRKGLSMDCSSVVDSYEQAGEERVITVTRMELVRNLFRRPLEVWLVLDRALYLQQQGYQVTVTEFCDYHLTPRNLMIQALKRDVPDHAAAAAQ